MPRPGQRSITISEKTYNEIKKIVSKYNERYSNPTQFVKHAIAELITKTRCEEMKRN